MVASVQGSGVTGARAVARAARARRAAVSARTMRGRGRWVARRRARRLRVRGGPAAFGAAEEGDGSGAVAAADRERRMGAGFCQRCSGGRRTDLDSDGAGRVHAAVSGDRSWGQHRQPERAAGAGADDRQVGSAEAPAVRQRTGNHEPAFSGLVREAGHRGRPHSAGAADAERLSGELQRPAARRVTECELVREPGRGEGEDRRVKEYNTERPREQSGISHAGGVCAAMLRARQQDGRPSRRAARLSG